MTKVTLIPAQPQQTEVVVVKKAVPAKIVVEMSLHEAYIVKTLLGKTNGTFTYKLYDTLTSELKGLEVEYQNTLTGIIPYMNFHSIESELEALKVRSES